MTVEVDIELGERVGAVGLERGEGERSGELEAKGGAGDEGARGDDEEGELGAFDGALQAIPERSGHAAEFPGGDFAEVEHDQAEVGVAGEKVGDAHRGGGVATAGPDEVG